VAAKRDYTNDIFVIEYNLLMKILILSPLFPPDTGAPADYVKELTQRLTVEHETTVLMYGYLPEAVPGSTLLPIDKRVILPWRLFSFTKTLLAKQGHELLLVNNAPSIELPLLVASFVKNISFVLIESDPIARHASERGLYKLLHTTLTKRAKKVVVLEDETTYKKAEVLPFVEFDMARESRRQTWWNAHTNHLMS
jgi:hypothetical protein